VNEYRLKITGLPFISDTHQKSINKSISLESYYGYGNFEGIGIEMVTLSVGHTKEVR
jgi:hypothetical protein